ncbi:MAG: stage II sporulation protein M [Bacilli bacterium]|nr:stage II sporulation protein M [Bacilli bacterium]
MNIDWIKKRKLLVILLFITIISFLFGSLFISILSDNNQVLVKESIISYFNGIKTGDFTYLKSLYSILSSNLIIALFIWIMGISIIGILLVVLLLIYYSFITGFSLVSILYTYGFKGILVSIIYMIPEVINLFVLFVLSYYSISFSILLFNYLFRKKDINRKVVVARYLKYLIISLGIFIITSFISVFVIPNILKFF